MLAALTIDRRRFCGWASWLNCFRSDWCNPTVAWNCSVQLPYRRLMVPYVENWTMASRRQPVVTWLKAFAGKKGEKKSHSGWIMYSFTSLKNSKSTDSQVGVACAEDLVWAAAKQDKDVNCLLQIKPSERQRKLEENFLFESSKNNN